MQRVFHRQLLCKYVGRGCSFAAVNGSSRGAAGIGSFASLYCDGWAERSTPRSFTFSTNKQISATPTKTSTIPNNTIEERRHFKISSAGSNRTSSCSSRSGCDGGCGHRCFQTVMKNQTCATTSSRANSSKSILRRRTACSKFKSCTGSKGRRFKSHKNDANQMPPKPSGSKTSIQCRRQTGRVKDRHDLVIHE